MIKVKNDLTWKTSVSIYIDVLEGRGTTETQKAIARDELMRLAVEMDKLNGKEIIVED